MSSLTKTHILLLVLALHSAALPLTNERRSDPLFDSSGTEDISKRAPCEGVLNSLGDCLRRPQRANTAPPGSIQGPMINQQPQAIEMQPMGPAPAQNTHQNGVNNGQTPVAGPPPLAQGNGNQVSQSPLFPEGFRERPYKGTSGLLPARPQPAFQQVSVRRIMIAHSECLM